MNNLVAYFATNRNRNAGGFGNGFHNDDPKEIRLGTVELTKSDGAWQASTIKTFPERSRATEGDRRARREWSQLGSTTGFQTIRDAGIQNGTSDILVFIHGAGNSFTDAAVTAALMAEQYSEPEAPVCPFFFSYPANGSSDPLNYLADRDDADLSGFAMARSFGKLVDFLIARKVATNCGQRIHLLAHSLGNFALRKAVTTIDTNPSYRSLRLFDTVFLAHADEDEDTLVHADKMRHLTRLTDRIVVYYDRTDKLLRLSDTVHMNRLGQTGPDPFPGPVVNGCEIAAVDCSETAFDVSPDRQRHRHYVAARAVIDDIRAVMRNKAPSGRTPLDNEGFFRLSANELPAADSS